MKSDESSYSHQTLLTPTMFTSLARLPLRDSNLDISIEFSKVFSCFLTLAGEFLQWHAEIETGYRFEIFTIKHNRISWRESRGLFTGETI